MTNREIKFRAWDKEGQRIKEVHKIEFSNKKVYLLDYYLNDYTFDKVELMQFTGLLDKNGKEIYEGDIVKRQRYYKGRENGQKVFKVEWSDGAVNHGYLLGDSFKLEVIGNIYENLELLKEVNTK